VDVDFDAAKDARNVAKHGISLARAVDLEIHAVAQDDRHAYGEPRFRAWGLIDGMAWCLAFTLRDGRVRAISLRRAGAKEWRERHGE
jgi:uncharacterized DUF497 family protein